MSGKRHSIFRFLFHRVSFIVISIILQVLLLVSIIFDAQTGYVYLYTLFRILSFLAVLQIVNNGTNPAYKIAWIIPILLFPIFGGLFYLLFGGNRISKKAQRQIRLNDKLIKDAFRKKEPVLNVDQSLYLTKYSMYPAYGNTFTEYLTSGEIKFQRMVEELQKAEHFIFLEYFILEEGLMWDTILEILAEKAKAGVDVRIIYDDFGCLLKLPNHYDRKLRKMGIKCCVFNRLLPLLYARLNNRDHRKILVIDGHTGITGGINLADEYINHIEKFGHWKDTSILLKGEGVYSFTVMFLAMWNFLTNTHEPFEKFVCPETFIPPVIYDENGQAMEQGFVQPYADTPLDNECVGKNTYLNIINAARRYVYITTPYLIIDQEMTTALTLAAKKGVDVRIVMPHIPDKPFIFTVSRAYYDTLVEAGVRIYEYMPGFIHSKTFVSDDTVGVVGTINLDYRSLYLHFECAVWLYQTPSLLSLKADFIALLTKCKEITLYECKSRNLVTRMVQAVLRIFSPLL